MLITILKSTPQCTRRVRQLVDVIKAAEQKKWALSQSSHVSTRRAGATRSPSGLSDVIPTTTFGLAVRNYVHAMADSQAFTLLSELLFDVSCHFVHAAREIIPAAARRPLQLIGA